MFSVDSILQRNKRPKMMKTFYGEHFTSKQTEPKCWMENTDVVNGLFLILKISDVTCQLKLKYIYIYILNIKTNY